MSLILYSSYSMADNILFLCNPYSQIGIPWISATSNSYNYSTLHCLVLDLIGWGRVGLKVGICLVNWTYSGESIARPQGGMLS